MAASSSRSSSGPAGTPNADPSPAAKTKKKVAKPTAKLTKTAKAEKTGTTAKSPRPKAAKPKAEGKRAAKVGGKGAAKASAKRDKAGAAGRLREVFLAGLGALGRARQGGPSFDELVARGEAVRASGLRAAGERVDEARERMDDVRERVGEAGATAAASVEAAVEAALDRLGAPLGGELDALRRQVEALRRRVAHLAGEPEAAAELRLRPADGGWLIEGAGLRETHPAKKAALAAARRHAKAQAPSRLTIHRADGSEQETVAYD